MKDEVRYSSIETASQSALALANRAVEQFTVDGAKPLDVIKAPRELWVAEIRRIQQHRDKQAFAALFRHFAPRVKAFLMKSGTSDALAEEVAQDVMATLWTKADQFDPSRASVATWIFTIARNRKIDMIRKQRRPEPEDIGWGPEPEPDQDEVMALRQDTELLGQALAGLPQKQRDLVQKAYFGDLSHSEIAAQTGLPLGTIKSRIRLALERLRHELK
ncbi:MAG: sigma-70 family RNA polymerase sigma factor [Pseudomonadota bacterium]